MIFGAIAFSRYIKTKTEKFRKEYFESHKHECGHLIGKQKERCIADLKRQSNEKKISELKKYMKKCDKTKDPYKCKQLMKMEIKKISRKIKL